MKSLPLSGRERFEKQSRETGTSPGRGSSALTQALAKDAEDPDSYLHPEPGK